MKHNKISLVGIVAGQSGLKKLVGYESTVTRKKEESESCLRENFTYGLMKGDWKSKRRAHALQ
jgi:hypothetical protein